MVVAVALADSAGLLSGGGEATELTVLVDGVADPVDAGVVADDLVHGVDQDDLKVPVGRILVDPVRVEHAEVSAPAASTALGNGTQSAGGLDGTHTLVGGLTDNGTLAHTPLPVSTLHADTVDDVSRLGLVTKTPRLVGTRGTSQTRHRRQLTVLPVPHTLQKLERITLLLAPQLFEVLVCSYNTL